MYAFRRLSEVLEITEHWLRQYNEVRPHDALGMMTPREYLTANSERDNYKSTWHNQGKFTPISGTERPWFSDKPRLNRFRSMNKNKFYLHLKECKFQYNYRKQVFTI